MSYSNLLDLISVRICTDRHIRMLQYDRNCSSRTNWFDFAGTPCLVFDPEPLNAFESTQAILAATFEEKPLDVFFGNSLMFPPLGIFIGQMQPGKVEVCILTTQCLENIGQTIED